MTIAHSICFVKLIKFMANNWFDKKIILLNKKKIYLLANTKSDKFFKNIIAINIMSLKRCKKTVMCVTNINLHNNCYSLIAKLLNLSLIIKHIVKDNLFSK